MLGVGHTGLGNGHFASQIPLVRTSSELAVYCEKKGEPTQVSLETGQPHPKALQSSFQLNQSL